MIYADAAHTDNAAINLVLNYPNGERSKIFIVPNEDAACRLVNRHTQLYIIDTLKVWIAHRINIFSHVNDTRLNRANALLSMLYNAKFRSLEHACAFVVLHADNLKFIAPGIKSRHYKRYCTEVAPILIFCHQMKGASHK